MQAFLFLFSIFTAQADPCYQEGLTWDHTDIIDIVGGVETVELCQAQCAGLEDDQCHFFTWNMLEDPHFPKLCHLFHNSSTEDKCDFCISGPKECECGYPGSCDIIEDNFVGYEAGVETEKQCHAICQEESSCEFYTWFDNTGHPYLFECFMYSSCESLDEDCSGCYSGPKQCGAHTTIKTTIATETSPITTLVTDHTTITVGSTVTPTEQTTITIGSTVTPTEHTTITIGSTVTPTEHTTITIGSSTPLTTPNSTLSCEVPSKPTTGNWSCQPSASALSCNLLCPQGYFSSSWSLPSDCTSGVWSVPPQHVECEEGVVLLVGGDSSEKSVELYGVGYHERTGFDLSSEKKQHTTDFMNGLILTCGGGSFSAEQKSCLSLDRVGSWTEHSELFDVRYGHSSLAILDSLAMVGGYIPHARTSTELYNMTQDVGWKQQPYLNEQLYNGCAVLVTETQFMTIGGDKTEKNVVRYEALTGTFNQEKELNVGRISHGCITLRNKEREGVLVVGGYDHESKERLTSTEFYDFHTHSWTEVANLQVPRSGVRLVQIGKTVYAMGGMSSGDVIEKKQSVEKLDLSTWTWSMAEEMLVPRSLHSATLIPKTYFE